MANRLIKKILHGKPQMASEEKRNRRDEKMKCAYPRELIDIIHLGERKLMVSVHITPFMVERLDSSTHRVQMTQTQLAPSVATKLFATHANLTTTKERHHMVITVNVELGQHCVRLHHLLFHCKTAW
jgi:hypothetical protein